MDKDSFNIIKTSLQNAEYLMRNYNVKKPNRELSLAITKIQEAIMWFNEIKVEE